MRFWIVVMLLGGCRVGFDPIELSIDGSIDSDAHCLAEACLAAGGTCENDVCTPGTAPEPATCLVGACEAAGGACVADVCELTAISEARLTCPAGMACRVLCNLGDRACRDGVDCGDSTTCEVVCGGDRACQAGVDCGAATCDVTCDGNEACAGGIIARAACNCHCCGGTACSYGVGACVLDNVCL